MTTTPPPLTTVCADQRSAWFASDHTDVDVLVIGGGVMGASVFHHLARAGLKAVLAERHDFSAGASQGSAGLVWGGLLYLRFGRLLEVAKWCREREHLMQTWPDLIQSHRCHYPLQPTRRNPFFVKAGLHAYGWLGGKPRHGPEGCLAFEEARVMDSDARLTWHWIASAPGNANAFNCCEAHIAKWDGARWQVILFDHLHQTETRVHARWVINAAGAWAKQLDQAAGIHHPFDLALSRGTSLVVPARGANTLIYEHPTEDDALTLVPFGEQAIWGSTEQLVDSPVESLTPTADEVAQLLDWHRCCVGPLAPEEVLAVRCGVRAMAVPAGWQAGGSRSQQLSRNLRLLTDGKHPWISLYGGKLSGCAAVGRDVTRRIAGRPMGSLLPRQVMCAPLITLPSLPQAIPDPAWCRDHEQCHSLVDYLRRRTHLAQCLPRAGAGLHNEYLPALQTIALTLACGDDARAKADLQHYWAHHVAYHDQLLDLLPQSPHEHLSPRHRRWHSDVAQGPEPVAALAPA